MSLWNELSKTYVQAYMNSTWYDITSYVLLGDNGSPIEGSIGRQTELDQTDPTALSFVLNNRDGRFTPDNTSGTYYPYWKSGVLIRWSETLGPFTYRFPDMYLEIPEVALSFESSADSTVTDRVLRVNCVDRLTRLNRAARFVSTLGEYIKYSAASGVLRAYWPIGDSSGSRVVHSAGPITQRPLTWELEDSTPIPQFPPEIVTFGAAGPPGDDGTAVEYSPASTMTSGSYGKMANSEVVSVDPSSSEYLTLSVWVYPQEPTSGGLGITALVRSALTTVSLAVAGNSSGVWTANVLTTSGSTALTSTKRILWGKWHLVSLTVDMATGNCELWVNASSRTTGTAGTGGTDDITRAVVYGGTTGTRHAHLQVYVGDSTAFARTDHIAQYEAGYAGLANQTVDARIRTICNYAGITDAELDLQPSDSLMPAASFAGQRPGTLASSAVTTGGGIMFTRESEIVYQDRKHRFNL